MSRIKNNKPKHTYTHAPRPDYLPSPNSLMARQRTTTPPNNNQPNTPNTSNTTSSQANRSPPPSPPKAAAMDPTNPPSPQQDLFGKLTPIIPTTQMDDNEETNNPTPQKKPLTH